MSDEPKRGRPAGYRAPEPGLSLMVWTWQRNYDALKRIAARHDTSVSNVAHRLLTAAIKKVDRDPAA